MFFEDAVTGAMRLPGKAGRKASDNKPKELKRLRYEPLPRRFLTGPEIDALPQGSTVVFDTEVYRNYFLIAFKHLDTGSYFYIERAGNSSYIDRVSIGYVMARFLVIGFNSNDYDIPILLRLLAGDTNSELKDMSNRLILDNERPEWGYVPYNHIDIIEVAPLSASLKLYAARRHTERLQELPIDPEATLTPAEMDDIREYCFSDLDNTEILAVDLWPQLELRKQLGLVYQQDLRSKSDAQIAEAVINSELAKKTGKFPRKPKSIPVDVQYEAPAYISYGSKQLQDVLELTQSLVFELDGNGSPKMPPELGGLDIRIGNGLYRMGMGGLHSQEECSGHVADNDTLIIDRDVASFYPRIILNNRYYPLHLGEVFLEVYEDIVTRRLSAKKMADKLKKAGKKDEAKSYEVQADGLKITINGGFGKFGSMYSTLYSPKLLLQVTITGQLSLLMLIEMIEFVGIPVVSANTDGIVIKCPRTRYEELNRVIAEWESITQFVTEETRYKKLYSRDVNNYIALKYKQDKEGNWLPETDGCKMKGTYAEVGSALNSPLSKNPESYIVSMALQALIEHDTPLEQTVLTYGENVPTKYYTKPISRFVSVRTVKGGAHKGGYYLGKVVRWYYAEGERGAMHYVLTGNAVPKSEGAKPLMQLGAELPSDIDLNRYIEDAYKAAQGCGLLEKPSMALL